MVLIMFIYFSRFIISKWHVCIVYQHSSLRVNGYYWPFANTFISIPMALGKHSVQCLQIKTKYLTVQHFVLNGYGSHQRVFDADEKYSL